MREPKLGDVVVRKDGKSGRIDIITDYEGITVIGVKYENSHLREFYAMLTELKWDNDRWRVK